MLLIKKAVSDEDRQHCFDIRFQVFVVGQQVPIEDDIDGKDAVSIHYLLKVDDRPAGVARVRYLDDYSKIERVGIVEEYQGRGLGRDLMLFILSDLRSQSTHQKVRLSSQTYAIPFYEKLGFLVCSDKYMDSGIMHKDMQMML